VSWYLVVNVGIFFKVLSASAPYHLALFWSPTGVDGGAPGLSIMPSSPNRRTGSDL